VDGRARPQDAATQTLEGVAERLGDVPVHSGGVVEVLGAGNVIPHLPVSIHLTPRSSIFAPGQPANIDARLLDSSDNALVSSFRNIRLQPNELPLRPGFGKVGKDIKLRANFFPVKVPKTPLFEYNVSISPATSIKRMKRRIFQIAEQTPSWSRLKGNVAHDHSQKLITAKKLPQPLNIKVPFYDEDEDGPKEGGKEYTLTIEFSGNLDMQSLHKCAVLPESLPITDHATGSYLEGMEQYRGYDILIRAAQFARNVFCRMPLPTSHNFHRPFTPDIGPQDSKTGLIQWEHARSMATNMRESNTRGYQYSSPRRLVANSASRAHIARWPGRARRHSLWTSQPSTTSTNAMTPVG